MATWIGPAIVAAVISALVTGLGWLVSERQAERRDLTRRREKVIDLQTALLAEIRAARHRLGDLREHGAAMDVALSEPGDYTPFVPRQVPPFVLNAVIGDLAILPTQVIDPLVIYYRQMLAVSHLVDDIRGERFAALDQNRKRRIYRDYLELIRFADDLAAKAGEALAKSLNIPGEDRSDPGSDGARAEASEHPPLLRSPPLHDDLKDKRGTRT